MDPGIPFATLMRTLLSALRLAICGSSILYKNPPRAAHWQSALLTMATAVALSTPPAHGQDVVRVEPTMKLGDGYNTMVGAVRGECIQYEIYPGETALDTNAIRVQEFRGPPTLLE